MESLEGVCWTVKEKKKQKHFFKCSECDKRAYIFKPATHSGAAIYLEDKSHIHFDRSRGVPNKTKEIVLQKYFEDKNKPKEIKRCLRDNLDQGYTEVTSKRTKKN